ncbi:hypothetical protein [Shewanella sp. YIC-542]|uniref:hypothetical protein n=1 Tax=Shewanella mytili TaxID=3377111 RepID=UPI00398E9201
MRSTTPTAAVIMITLYAGSPLPSSAMVPHQPPPAAQRAVDANGNPLPIPREFEAALEYRSREADVPVIKNTPQKRARKSRQKTAPQVADDASCRWLYQRMTTLQNRLQQQSHIDKYLQVELGRYRQQWRCLKCAKGGPGSAELSRCRP